MVCYTIPLIATLIVTIRRRTLRRKDPEGFWLNLLLLGGSLFGVIDHLWNGELFLVGPNIVSDLMLGFAITGGIFVTWGIIAFRERITKLRFLSRRMGLYR